MVKKMSQTIENKRLRMHTYLGFVISSKGYT